MAGRGWSISGALLIAALIVIPALVVPALYEPYREPRLLAFRLFGAMLFPAALAGGRAIRWQKPEAILVIALIFWSIVATFLSLRPELSFRSLLTVLAALSVFLAAAGFAARGHRFFPRLVLALGGVFGLGYSLGRLFSWNPLGSVDIRTGADAEMMRLGVQGWIFGNRNDVGSILALCLPLCMAVALSAEERFVRLLAWCCTVLAAAGLVFSQTVTALIAAAIAVVVVVACALRGRRRLIVLGVVGTIGAATIAIAFVQRADAFPRNLVELDRLTSFRVRAFRIAALMVQAEPLHGVGPGNFGAEFYRYALLHDAEHPSLAAASPASLVNWGEVHNDYLQVASETGVPGLLILLAIIVLLARHGWRGSRPRAPTRAQALPPFGLLVAFVVLAAGQFPLQAGATLILIVAAAGWLFGAVCAD